MTRSCAAIWLATLIAFASVYLSVAAPAATNPGPTSPAKAPYIDAHVHLEDRGPAGVRNILAAGKTQNVRKLFMLVPPYATGDPGIYDAEPLLALAKQHPNQLAVLGGGGSLNAMLQDAVKNGDNSPATQQKFKARAEQLVRIGVVGFGELTTEHFPSPTSPEHQYAPADHPLLLLLADIAAQHHMPIVLHIEAVPKDMPLPALWTSPPNPPKLVANIAALGRLAAHNPHARIIWAHAGQDPLGYRTPELCRQVLQAHSNIFMEIKNDPMSPGKNPLLENGKIKPEWLKLFEDFPDRFLIGSDQHYPMPKDQPQRWRGAVDVLDQLPPDLREKIAIDNPLRIYSMADAQ